jgi:phosphoserine phosphatase
VLATCGAQVVDVEQVRVHGNLLLSVEADGDPELSDRLEHAFASTMGASLLSGLAIRVTALDDRADTRDPERHLVTVLAPELGAPVLSQLFAAVASAAGNIERILQLSRYPVISYELTVTAPDSQALRAALVEAAARCEVDVSVQRGGLHRRARHLIVLDVDSTLLQGEVIDLLAARTEHADEVAAVTAAAMAGQLDFTEALQQRVALLAGLPATVLEEVGREVVPTPGARTLVRTLRRLGYVTAAVSGGFTQVIEGVASELGIDHVEANELEVRDGRLTGRLTGPVIDRAGKAEALRRFASASGIELERTIAVGDGANDLDMLTVAGLGIAFNAKPVLRDAADTALNVPYLDAILYLLGISREEVEAADRSVSASSSPVS